MKNCAFEGCPNKASPKASGGLCNSHYWQKHMGRELTPLAYRRDHLVPWLEAHKDHKGSECLTWPGKPKADGYGQVKINGVNIGAHRQMCIMVNGEPPFEGAEAAHSCGNGDKGCVNPNHLRWDTRQGNVDDTLIHGTRVRGERCHAAILNEQQVRDIREIGQMFDAHFIASEFQLKVSHVQKILRGAIWRHVA